MQIEVREMEATGLTDAPRVARRAFGVSLAHFQQAIERVRVRLRRAAGGAAFRCTARIWCDHGPTVVVGQIRSTLREAIDATADATERALRRRRERARRDGHLRRPDRGGRHVARA